MEGILLLGGTGKTGTEVLRYALLKGYHITILARDPGKVSPVPGRLTIIKGSPLIKNDLRAATGYNAVISTLGHLTAGGTGGKDRKSPSTLMTDSIKNMLNVMNENGIRRIVVQTGAGAGDSFGKMPGSIQKIIRETSLAITYNDHNGQEQELVQSKAEWTIVRPVTMTEGDEGKVIIVEGDVKESFTISRKTVARFLVDCLVANEFIGKAVVISQNN